MTKGLYTFVLGLGLLAAGLFELGPSPVMAQSCYSTDQARSAVQAGQVQPLSNLVGQIQAVAPGQIVSSQLCNVGGRWVYLVSVLVGGQVRQVQVDAATGSLI
jgi:uncharacterized membrane protein YkoI